MDSEAFAFEAVLEEPVEYRDVDQRRSHEGRARLVVGALPHEQKPQEERGAHERPQEPVNRSDGGEFHGSGPATIRMGTGVATSQPSPRSVHTPAGRGPNRTFAFSPAGTRLTQSGTGGHAMEATHYQFNPIETNRLRGWIAKWIGASWVWHAKFLSGTETSATQARRSGPCVPRDLLEPAFPSLADDAGATTVEFDIEIDSHGVQEDRVRAVPHIGNGLFGTPRAEMRITDFATASPLLDPREHRRAGDLRVSAGPWHRLPQVPDMDLPEPGRDGRCGRPDRPGGAGFPCPVGPSLNRPCPKPS